MHHDPNRIRGALLGLAAGMTAAWLAGDAAAQEAGNPCSLLTAPEVEAVLGEPLAGPPYRTFGHEPDPEGTICRYETQGFRAVAVEVDWTGGKDTFGMFGMVTDIAEAGGVKGLLALSDGTQVTGAWDQAMMFMCCQFNALLGDQRVMVDIGATKLTEKEAAGLADLAVQRLGQPLEVAADAGLAEAAERNKARPAVAPACSLVTRAEAEALVGAPLVAEPEGDETECTYVWTPAGTDYQDQITLLVTWRGGFGEMQAMQAAVGSGLDMLAGEGLNMGQEEAAPNPVFEAYASSIIGVAGVRKDVMLSIESGPMSDLAAQFLAVAGEKI